MLSVRLHNNSLERFCKEETIQVSKRVVTGVITLNVIGLDFNTPENLFRDYISKFGGVFINLSLIYSKFSEGPFKGKYTGERKLILVIARSPLEPTT